MADNKQSLTPSSFKTFGELLGFLRKRAHVSQRELATYVGYHYSHISRVENNSHTPDVNTVKALFIPALALETDHQWAERLVQLAQGENTKTRAETNSIPNEESMYNLPANLTSIVGREKETELIIHTVLNTDVRLLTIIGPPGVGKTRIAAEVAENITNQFSNGAIFINLAPVEYSKMVMPAISEAVGLQETSTAYSLANLQSFLKHKNLLIILDNFEQVLSAAPQVSVLLNHAPKIKIIITSREALRIQGEHEFQLAPLQIAEENSKLDDSPATRLFVERAQSVDANFQITEENASRVAEVCRRLDGLPLAIELAAARIRTLTPTAMLEQFDRRFDWLTRGTRDPVSSRQTLQGAIEWSYNLLSETDRVLLRRASIFAGGWTLEAVDEICSDKSLLPKANIMDALLQLVDRSLVVVETIGDHNRYKFLNTLRYFAQEKLEEAKETTAFRNRHLKYFANWTENSESLLDKASPLKLRAIVELEHNNIRTALDWGLIKQADRNDALKLAVAAGFIWLKHSHFKEALEWVEKYLPLAEENKDRKTRLLYLGSALSYWRGSPKASLDYALQAEKIGRALNDKKLLANILYYLSEIYKEANDYKRSQAILDECIALCRETNHSSRLTLALTSLSILYFYIKDKKRSDESIKEAMHIAIKEKIQWGQSYALRVKANNLRLEGKCSESLAAYELALNLSDAIDDRISAGMSLANMSLLANVLEDYPTSMKYAQRAFKIFQAIGNEYQQPYPFRLMAYAALHTGEITKARSLCVESITRNHEMGEGHEIGVTAGMITLAEIELTQKNYNSAIQLYHTAERFTKEFLFSFQEADALSYERVKKRLKSRQNPQKSKALLVEWKALTLDEVYQKIMLNENNS